MSVNNSDNLFHLIKTLSKAEKRYFKLYVFRTKTAEDSKFIKLFDFIDKSSNFDEKKIIAKIPEVKASQLSNIKAHLYKQILHSLRNQNIENDPEIILREHLDYAVLLYNRCLYKQSLKLLEKAKKLDREAGIVLAKLVVGLQAKVGNRIGYRPEVQKSVLADPKIDRRQIRERVEFHKARHHGVVQAEI